jgi:hypothetical protein
LFDLGREEEIKECFNYINLVPMFIEDNRMKGGSSHLSLIIMEGRAKVYDNPYIEKLIDRCRKDIEERWNRYK